MTTKSFYLSLPVKLAAFICLYLLNCQLLSVFTCETGSFNMSLPVKLAAIICLYLLD